MRQYVNQIVWKCVIHDGENNHRNRFHIRFDALKSPTNTIEWYLNLLEGLKQGNIYLTFPCYMFLFHSYSSYNTFNHDNNISNYKYATRLNI